MTGITYSFASDISPNLGHLRFLDKHLCLVHRTTNSVIDIDYVFRDRSYNNVKSLLNFKVSHNHGYTYESCTLPLHMEMNSELILAVPTEYSLPLTIQLDQAKNSVGSSELVIVKGDLCSNVTKLTFADNSGLKYVSLSNSNSITSCEDMFNGCSDLVWCDAFDLSGCNSTKRMFSNCSSLKVFNDFDLTNIQDASYMFYYSGIEKLPVLRFSKVWDTSYMFDTCIYLRELPLFDTSKVEDASAMFRNCTTLRTSPSFNMVSATTLNSMYYGCVSLVEKPNILNISDTCITANMYSGTKYA